MINSTYLSMIKNLFGFAKPVVELILELIAVVFELEAFKVFVDTLQLLD